MKLLGVLLASRIKNALPLFRHINTPSRACVTKFLLLKTKINHHPIINSRRNSNVTTGGILVQMSPH